MHKLFFQTTVALMLLAAAAHVKAQIRPFGGQSIQKVRPFITDDARVVGNRLAQLESWFRGDEEASQQWALVAYGPTPNLELTFGGVGGVAKGANKQFAFTYALPLLQGKYLIREYAPNAPPGVAVVLGTFLPFGSGFFVPPGYGTFGFLTVSQCLLEGEIILIHGNLGANYLNIDGKNQTIVTWGLGTQIKVYGGFHFVGEIFSGDPYIPGTGEAVQVGFRHFFSDYVQIDGTVGKGLGGRVLLPLWFSAGVRIVFTFFQ